MGSRGMDPGPPNQWRRVRAFRAEGAVRQVVVTHYHEDHGGNLAPIRSAFAAPVYAPRLGLAELASGFPQRPYQRLFWGRPKPVQARELPPQVPLDGGGALEAIPAAGHSSDMTCLLERERGWLFAGDLYIAARTRLLRQGEGLGAEVASRRRPLGPDFEAGVCAPAGVPG